MSGSSLLILNNEEESQFLPRKKKSKNILFPEKGISFQKDYVKGIIKILNCSNDPKNTEISIKVYSYRINYLLDEGKALKKSSKCSLFESSTKFEESIQDFLPRIIEMLQADGRKILLSLYALEKALEGLEISLNRYNILRLIFVSIIEICKFYDDLFTVNLKPIAEVLGTDLDDFMQMEMDFLTAINYKLDVPIKEFGFFTKKIATDWINKIINNNH